MIKPYVERDPDYNPNEKRKQYPIYKKQAPQKQQPKPPKRLQVKELFNYLNIWNCDLTRKHEYVDKFKMYLQNKRETIEMEEIEKQMKKPDFIRFFKYLKEEKKDDDFHINIEMDIAYTEYERRMRSSKKAKRSDQRFQPYVKEERFTYPSGFDPHKQIEQPTPDDFVIVTHFFKQCTDQRLIDKELIISQIISNTKFMKAYKINKFLVEDKLNEFPTQVEDRISLDEFINFILYPKTLIVNDNEPMINLPQIIGVNLFKDKSLIKARYDELNLNQENQVDINRLIGILRHSIEFKDMLFKPFIKFDQIEKSCTFEKWIYELEIWCALQNIIFINYQQLDGWYNQLFDIPNKAVILRSNQLSHKRQYNKLYQDEILKLPSHFYSHIERIFQQTQKTTIRHRQKNDVINALKCDDEFMKKYENLKVRTIKTNQTDIETVGQTIERIIIESEDYIDLDELIDFFTVRGRPLNIVAQKPIINKTIKKQEDHTCQDDGFGAINKKASNFLITIPRDALLDEQKPKTIRQKNVEEMLFEKEKEELKNITQKYKAAKVPWYVTEPLYDQFNREREERSQRRKEESKAKLMESMMEPKNFEKVPKQLTLEPEIEFKYKSRPIPNSTKNPLFDQIVFEKKIRSRSNVARRKHDWDDYFINSEQMQNWEMRQKEHKMRRKSSNKNAYSPPKSKRIRAKSMPNFEKLHVAFENELLARRKEYEPTIPYTTNLTTRYTTIQDNQILDIANIKQQLGEQKIKDADARLNKILQQVPPNIKQTKSSRSISKMRRKQKYENQEKLRKEEESIDAMKKQRQKLLPKYMEVSNPAAKQQKILDAELEELVEWKKRYHKNMDKNYEKQLKKIYKKVQKRPLLMYDGEDSDEGYNSDSSSIEKTQSHIIVQNKN